MGAGRSTANISFSKPNRQEKPERKPVRNVDLQVLCLGLPRTGTASLRQALRYLGYGDVYHFMTVYNEHPADANHWYRALEAKYKKGEGPSEQQWTRLAGNCAAVTDIPCIIFAKELMEQLPNAKVILTVRDSPEQWLDSYKATVRPWFKRIHEKYPAGITGKIKQIWRKGSATEDMCAAIQKHYLGPLELRGKAGYEEHNRWITRMVEEKDVTKPFRDRFLLYNVKEGWEPLCEFLNKGTRKNDFPHVKERDSFPSMFNEKVM